jgi:hypothetical protein
MCHEIDYIFFAEQQKAEEARIKQGQRAQVINKLLNEATQAEPTGIETAPIKEVAPAK